MKTKSEKAKKIQEGISFMNDLLHSLDNCQGITFLITEGDETVNEYNLDSTSHEMFRDALIATAEIYKENNTVDDDEDLPDLDEAAVTILDKVSKGCSDINCAATALKNITSGMYLPAALMYLAGDEDSQPVMDMIKESAINGLAKYISDKSSELAMIDSDK